MQLRCWSRQVSVSQKSCSATGGEGPETSRPGLRVGLVPPRCHHCVESRLPRWGQGRAGVSATQTPLRFHFSHHHLLPQSSHTMETARRVCGTWRVRWRDAGTLGVLRVEEPAHALPAAPATLHGVEILKAPGGLPPFRKPSVLRSPREEGDGGTCATCR